MELEQLKKLWLSNKEFIDDPGELVKVEKTDMGGNLRFYHCPCGSEDHYALRGEIQEGYSCYPSPILNCYFTKRQWLIKPVSIASVIREEEERFIRNRDKYEETVRKVVKKRGKSEETIAFLWDTHGIERNEAMFFMEAL